MLNRRDFLELSGWALSLSPARLAYAGTAARRALVIGIDEYVPKGGGGGAASSSNPVKRDRSISNLDGAVNDATLMAQILKDRFGFPAANVVLLTNKQATRDRILSEFKKQLIDSASSGDVSFFYYAGHGSQVTNLGSDESDQRDETFVPADTFAGAPDIRDKEMARLYRAALQKGVTLTVVLDSCHSGGMARGIWNAGEKIRQAQPTQDTVNDPPDRDPATGKKLPDPAELGLLFLAAARKDQTASEVRIADRAANRDIVHGAFTAALVRVLQSPMAGESVQQICERVQGILASQGKSQVPICGGIKRGSRGLLGEAGGAASAIAVSAEGLTDDGLVRLRGGSAIGLTPGCTLSRANGRPVRLELVHVELALSRAKIIGPAVPVQPGDLFKLDSWTAPPEAALHLYVGANPPALQSIQAVALQLALLHGKNGVTVLSAESLETAAPTHVLSWKKDAYLLETFPRSAEPVVLGASPSAETIAKALGNRGSVRLWAILPPSKELSAQLNLGAGTANIGVQLTADPASCTYLLAGQWVAGKLEYCWILRDALAAERNRIRLPLRTDSSATGPELTSVALRLAKIYAWLNMEGPAGGDSGFPYRLTLENAATHQRFAGAPLKFGEKYKIVFEADSGVLQQINSAGALSRRYVYVFVIDSDGKSTCVFPGSSDGNNQNLLPRGQATPRIVATNHEWDLAIAGPAGTDNYFMVASEQPLDPLVFQWDGVVQQGVRGGNSLDFLFNSLGNGTRGVQTAPNVPVTWSIQSMAVRSIPQG